MKVYNKRIKNRSRQKSQFRYVAMFMAISTLFLFMGFSIAQSQTKQAFYPTFPIVAIDAGHGGIDKGATAFGYSESDLNLKVAKSLSKTLENLNLQTVMTRKDQNGLYGTTLPGFKVRDMKARKKICESAHAEILVSLHMNASEIPDRKGVVVYCNSKNDKSTALANAIASQFEGGKVKSGDFYITNKIETTAVIVECGFITTKTEAEKLATKEYQDDIARSIARGILIYQRNCWQG